MTRATDPMLRVWGDIAESRHNITETHRLLSEYHRDLGQVLDTNLEQPGTEQVREQALRAYDLVSAAQQYARDVTKLWVLCGGDVRPSERQGGGEYDSE